MYLIGSWASSSGVTSSRQATLIDTKAPPISFTSPSPNGAMPHVLQKR